MAFVALDRQSASDASDFRLEIKADAGVKIAEAAGTIGSLATKQVFGSAPVNAKDLKAGSQTEQAAPAVRNAILQIYGESAAKLGEDAFSFDRADRRAEPLAGRAGLVRRDPKDASSIQAFVAHREQLATLAQNYSDPKFGLSAAAFDNGLVANEVGGKVAALAFGMKDLGALEVISEAASFAAAGPNWAFRTLVSMQSEQASFDSGRQLTNYAQLLGLTHLSLGQAAADVGVDLGGKRPIEAGAQIASDMFKFLGQSDTFQRYKSFPDAVRGFAQERLDLTPEKAEAFTDGFRSRADSNFREAATQLRNILSGS